jgi:membrane protease YdiL (CAAX protease family)
VSEPLRLFGPLVLALVSAVAVDQLMRARQMQPPGLADPLRRAVAFAVTASVMWLGVFLALGQVGLPPAPERQVAVPELFLLHAVFLLALVAWFLAGHAGALPAGTSLAGTFWRQMGLATPRPFREAGLGFLLGLLTWPGLLVALIVALGLLFLFGGESLLPTQPPGLIVWIAALPIPVKLAVALSAGVVEEVFFRGFLQPRVGIGVSTLLFVLAHLSYDQPFMLIGITLLSLFFAFLVEWRQNLWPAIAAHFLFDAVQLLFLIPWALREWPSETAPPFVASPFIAALLR